MSKPRDTKMDFNPTTGNEAANAVNQLDANFLAGIEVGVHCAEKGMNLQAALAFGKETVRLYPVRQFKQEKKQSCPRK